MKNLVMIVPLLVLALSSCKKEVTMKTDKVTDSVKTVEPMAEQPLDSAAKMKAWTAFATPGAAHKMMADENGTWTCDMTFWEEPDGKPSKATSVAHAKMIFDGRYQETDYQGTMMGQPFEGKSTLAFNNASKEYTTTFIDNMGTGMMVLMGKYDEKTKTMDLKGEMVNPINGNKTPYRETYTIVDPTTRKMEMFDTKNGKEYKCMEIIMKKK